MRVFLVFLFLFFPVFCFAGPLLDGVKSSLLDSLFPDARSVVVAVGVAILGLSAVLYVLYLVRGVFDSRREAVALARQKRLYMARLDWRVEWERKRSDERAYSRYLSSGPSVRVLSRSDSGMFKNMSDGDAASLRRWELEQMGGSP